MHLEDLVGKPSYELLPLIASVNNVRQFFLTGFEEKSYTVDNTLYPFDPQSFTNPEWYVQARAGIPRKHMGVVSRVVLGSEFAHIPMLDYDDADDGEKASVDELEGVLNKLHLPPGAIISSGNGLHYIGALVIHDQGFYKLIKTIEESGHVWQGGMMSDQENPGVDWRFLLHGQNKGFFELRLSGAEISSQMPIITGVYRPQGGISMEAGRDYGISLFGTSV